MNGLKPPNAAVTFSGLSLGMPMSASVRCHPMLGMPLCDGDPEPAAAAAAEAAEPPWRGGVVKRCFSVTAEVGDDSGASAASSLATGVAAGISRGVRDAESGRWAVAEGSYACDAPKAGGEAAAESCSAAGSSSSGSSRQLLGSTNLAAAALPPMPPPLCFGAEQHPDLGKKPAAYLA